MELQKTGRDIVILESGGGEFDGTVQALNDGVPTALDETDLTGPAADAGGTSHHRGGHCLPLDSIDFARAPLSGQVLRQGIRDEFGRGDLRMLLDLGRFVRWPTGACSTSCCVTPLALILRLKTGALKSRSPISGKPTTATTASSGP